MFHEVICGFLLRERKKEGEWGLSERSRETDIVLRIRECMYQLLCTNVVHKKRFTTRFSSRRFFESAAAAAGFWSENLL